MRNYHTTLSAQNTTSSLEVPPHHRPTPCPLCGRSPAPFTVQRSDLLDTLTLLADVAVEAHDVDGRQLLLALAWDAKAAAERVSL
jgi:hypothetical protein